MGSYTTCPKGKTTEGVCITGYECVTAGDEDALAAARMHFVKKEKEKKRNNNKEEREKAEKRRKH